MMNRRTRIKLKDQRLEKNMVGSFYSIGEIVHQSNKEALDSVKNFKQPKSIEPLSVKIDNTKMTESEKAFMLARKYRFEDPTYTLKDIWRTHKKKVMNLKNIEMVYKIVAEIKLATSSGPV